ncbi:hypothetical protein MKW98_028828 [Papaver atlanticum]|uniref:PGG domain-containing protein n=1 Tax=Papaver atlanticum TaxID=357466 RepID=A0AAD4S2P8_9MAGN|nr:hypothetical protein MKW98_028828 [Papaver atlanticum]
MAAATTTNLDKFVISDELLTSNNYKSWEVVMRRNLEWHNCKEALEAIKKSCSAEMLPHIMYAEFARESLGLVQLQNFLVMIYISENYNKMLATAARASANSEDVPEVDKVLTRHLLLSKYLWTIVDGSDTVGSRSYKTKNHNALVTLRMSYAWCKLEDKLGAPIAASMAYSNEIIIENELLIVIVDYETFTTSSNYENWAFCMKNYLIVQGLWGFLEEPEISDCVKDEKALDAIKASCTPEMRAYVLYMDCAKHAWEKLATVAASIGYEVRIHGRHCERVRVAAKIREDLSKHSETDKVLTRSNYQIWEEYVTMLLGSRLLSDVVLQIWEEYASALRIIKEACALRIIKEACGRDMMPHIYRSKSPREALKSLGKACLMDQKDECMKYSRLLHAVQKNGFRERIQDRNGDIWRGAHKFFRDFPEALTAEITEDGSTALHVAVRLSRVDFVRELLKFMTTQQSELKTHQGNTVIAVAAGGNNIEIVQMLVKSNPRLLQIGNENHLHAVTIAAINGNEMIMRYLYPSTLKSTQWWGARAVASLLTSASRLDAFDIVQDLLSHFPADYALERDDYGTTLLSVLAEKPSAFPSGNQFGLGLHMGRDASAQPHKTLLKALKITVQHICSTLPNLNPHQLEESLIYEAIHRSTTHGIIEVFENLIDTNPYLEHYKDENDRGLFQIAIMARQDNIFRYISQMGPRNQSIALLDKLGNNALHCAGYWNPSSRLDKVHGPALRMQREIQWNMEERTGNETPADLFSLQHKSLAKEGEKWMKETAQACMIVTTLISTVMFAAAFTLPGGSDQSTGRPLSATTMPFKIFIVSDAVALFSSCTSVLMFFSILTSPYAQRDFLLSLPRKLILGLFTLLISIVTMMSAFAATLVIVLCGEASWVYIPVSMLASIPALLFGVLQLPLFVNILLSTYGSGIFHTKRIVLALLTGISYG